MRTLKFSPSGDAVVANVAVPYYAGDFPYIYVDANAGDDSNEGTEFASPFRTLEAAIALARLSGVPSTVYLAAGDYDSEPLRWPVQPKGLRVVGTDFIELAPEMAVSAYTSATTREVTVSPNPGWTNDQWEGAFLQWTNGPQEIAPEARTKLIIDNTANTVAITYPPLSPSGTGTSSIGPGNYFRIVKPAARLVGFTLETSRESMVGGASVGLAGGFLPNKLTTLENLEVVCEGATATQFSGAWALNGVRFVTSLNQNWEITFSHGFLAAGDGEVADQSQRGWGIACVNEGGFRRPILNLQSMMGRIFTCVGSLHLSSASYVLWEGGSARDTGTNFPHGTVSCLGGSRLFQNVYTAAQVGRYRIYSESTNYDFYCESGGTIEMDAPLNHEGSGGLAQARYNSTFKTSREIVQQGSNAELYALYGSIMRLQTAGTTFGESKAGATAALGQVVRAAGLAYAVGDAVCTFANFPKDLSNIFRSA